MAEEFQIRKVVAEVLEKLAGEEKKAPSAGFKVPIVFSNRHVHLSQEDFESLFGPGCVLSPMKDLSQPGQFACRETVTVVGPKGVFQDVRILGPFRKASQVEISISDSFALGISPHPPVRDSGDHEGTPGIVMVGPCGALNLKRGLIVAQRHIHMTPADAEKQGLQDRQYVRVSVEGERPLIYEKVLIRVSPDYALDMHVDLDEANAAALQPGQTAGIIK
ncbi:MAG: phosphate propanoyltransferase [bacterium]